MQSDEEESPMAEGPQNRVIYMENVRTWAPKTDFLLALIILRIFS